MALPTGNTSSEHAANSIRDMTEMFVAMTSTRKRFGLSFYDVLQQTALTFSESNGERYANAATSSAKYLGQFTDPTINTLLSRYSAEFTDTSDRSNPTLQGIAVNALAYDDSFTYRKKADRDTLSEGGALSAAEKKLSHVMGGTSFPKYLNATDNTSITKIMSANAIKANYNFATTPGDSYYKTDDGKRHRKPDNQIKAERLERLKGWTKSDLTEWAEKKIIERHPQVIELLQTLNPDLSAKEVSYAMTLPGDEAITYLRLQNMEGIDGQAAGTKLSTRHSNKRFNAGSAIASTDVNTNNNHTPAINASASPDKTEITQDDPQNASLLAQYEHHNDPTTHMTNEQVQATTREVLSELTKSLEAKAEQPNPSTWQRFTNWAWGSNEPDPTPMAEPSRSAFVKVDDQLAAQTRQSSEEEILYALARDGEPIRGINSTLALKDLSEDTTGISVISAPNGTPAQITAYEFAKNDTDSRVKALGCIIKQGGTIVGFKDSHITAGVDNNEAIIHLDKDFDPDSCEIDSGVNAQTVQNKQDKAPKHG